MTYAIVLDVVAKIFNWNTWKWGALQIRKKKENFFFLFIYILVLQNICIHIEMRGIIIYLSFYLNMESFVLHVVCVEHFCGCSQISLPCFLWTFLCLDLVIFQATHFMCIFTASKRQKISQLKAGFWESIKSG